LKRESDNLKGQLNMTAELNTSVRDDCRRKLFAASLAALAKQKSRCERLQKSYDKAKAKEKVTRHERLLRRVAKLPDRCSSSGNS
jgi:hypothetical protein